MNTTLFMHFWVGLALAIAFLSVSPGPAAGQAEIPDKTWSLPQELFREKPGEYTNELWLLRDPADNLYVWWPVFPEDTDGMTPREIQNASTVFHTQRANGRWQEPRDVLVWPSAGMNLTSAVVDSRGTIHAFSPTDCLSYVSVPHDQSMDPRAWSEPVCVDSMGTGNIAVAIDADDVLYLAYTAPGSQTIRLATSVDDGLNWTTNDVATVQSYDGPIDGFFSAPGLSIDELGRLHLVWSPASPPSGYPLLGVLYSRSVDGGQTWTTPLQLGEEQEGQPAIAVWGDQVHVLWNGDAAKRGRYYRHSLDGGATWQPIEKLGDGGGLQRPPALILDNRGNLHAMLHEQESLFYIAKIDNQWTAKTPLYSPGEQNAFEVFTVRLAITGGSQLETLYTLLANDGRRAIYHQQLTIDAVPRTPAPWPTTFITSTPVPTALSAAHQAIVTNTPTPRFSLQAPPRQVPASSLGYPVIVGASTALMLVLGAVVIYGVRHRR